MAVYLEVDSKAMNRLAMEFRAEIVTSYTSPGTLYSEGFNLWSIGIIALYPFTYLN